MFNRVVFYLVLTLLLQTPSAAQDFTARLVPDLTLGDDESAPLEYLFAAPRNVVTDSEGRIYVHDRNQAGIRVFTEGGQHLTTIGERGEGPGEFQDVISMTVGPDDELIVVDRMNHRVTRILDLGETIETQPFPEEQIVSAFWVGALGERGYLFYYRVYQDWDGGNPEEDELLHQFTSDFKPVASFGTGDEFYDLSSSFLRSLPGGAFAFHFSTCGATCILIAPTFYHGRFFKYEHDQNSGWQRSKTLEGRVPPMSPFEELNRNAIDDIEAFVHENRNTYLSSGRLVRVQSRSRGVQRLSDGTILHFHTMREGDQWIHGVELFNTDGEYIGFAPIENLEPGDSRNPHSYNVKWVDDQDRLYVVREQDGFPIIERVRLEVEGLDN